MEPVTHACGRCWSRVGAADAHCEHCGALRGVGWGEDPLEERVLSERYVLEQRIGEGGMALVYRALDRRLQRKVAIKLLRPELQGTVAARRFLGEARLASRLRSPHVLEVFDFGESEGLAFIASELLGGSALEDLLGRGPMAPDFVLEMLRQVGEALDEAHRAGIVHRDVKPGNLIVTERPTGPWFKLLDFGIARAVEVIPSTRLTRTGFVVGSPAYMAPEQVVGERDVDGRSDLFSLGLIATELLTGRSAHRDGTGREVMYERISEDLPPLAESLDDRRLPAGLCALVDALVRRNREERLPSAARLLDLLEDLELAAALSSPPPPRAGADAGARDPRDTRILHRTDVLAEDVIDAVVRRPRRRRRLALAAAALLGLGAWASTLELELPARIPPTPPIPPTVVEAALPAEPAEPAPEPDAVRRGEWNDVRVSLRHAAPVAGEPLQHLVVAAERLAAGQGQAVPLGGATLRLLHPGSDRVVSTASRSLDGGAEATFGVGVATPGRYHVDVALRVVGGDDDVRFRCDICTEVYATGCSTAREACMPLMASEVAHR